MKKESFLKAEQDIKQFFLKDSRKAYTQKDLYDIFESNRFSWGIAGYRKVSNFENFVVELGILDRNELDHQKTGSRKEIWYKPKSTNFDIALTIRKDGYLTNFSAMQLHQLTLQIPKTIYVSTDKYGNNSFDKGPQLNQGDVDKAFSKPQRTSSEVYKSLNDGFRFFLLQKKTSSIEIGVMTMNGLKVTDIERTLIDIAIRPVYSGGVFEVLNTYEQAEGKADPEKIFKYLDQLDYIYPYHQLIGFYLERAGYSEKSLVAFQQRVGGIDFYLTYNMSNKLYDQKWKLFYPNGF